MKFFKAILHKKIDANNPQPPATTTVLLPVDAIQALKEVDRDLYAVYVKPGNIPKVHFEVGKVDAILTASQIEVL